MILSPFSYLRQKVNFHIFRIQSRITRTTTLRLFFVMNILIRLNVLGTGGLSVLFLLDQGGHFWMKTILNIWRYCFHQKMDMLDQSVQVRSEHRSPTDREGSIFSIWKTIEAIWGNITDFVYQKCKLWVQSSPGAERWQNCRSRSCPCMLGLRWFLCVSKWYQSLSLATTIRPATLIIVHRDVPKFVHYCESGNRVFFTPSTSKRKMTLSTGWCALRLLWNGIFSLIRFEQVLKKSRG